MIPGFQTRGSQLARVRQVSFATVNETPANPNGDATMDHRGLPKARRGHGDAEVQEPGQTCGRGLQPKAKVPHLRVTRWDDRGSAAGMAPPRRPLHPLYFHREREPARELPAAQTAARNGSSRWWVIEAERVAGPRGGPKEDPLLPLRDRSTSRRCSVGLDGRKPEGPRGGRPSASDPSSPLQGPRGSTARRTHHKPMQRTSLGWAVRRGLLARLRRGYERGPPTGAIW